ncbi:RidA family protein [Sulfitobacter sp. F26204]|uniref:RidA family protein n=1 Tax=Sulfitobacter sp. F26204 TaxID=2996014 RepID=UPI00225DD75F|nr:RidA family protein [Sulfitobacter sp. F26204]MCX7560704.1 RidA family protein [Sulfitobacter sp. F26204]
MQLEKPEFIEKPGQGDPRPFSRVCKAGGMVYVSGHSAPHNPDAGIYRGDTPAEEVRNALTYIKTLLEQAGSDIDHVVQVTMLITDPADYHALNAEYIKHFPNGLPARHTARFGVPTQARVGFACIAMAAKGN